jgi:hypothetical protein
LISGGGIASMSAALRHVFHGMAGDTAAPRPTLVNAACWFSVVEHDSAIMETKTPRMTHRPLNSLFFSIRDPRVGDYSSSLSIVDGVEGGISVSDTSVSSYGRTVLVSTALVILALTVIAQTPTVPAPTAQKPGMAPRPPLLFSEPWKLPPYTGEQTDENMRFTPAVVTNPRIEVKLYGQNASVIRAAVHEERIDLWNGMSSSPVAVTLRDRSNYVDLSGAARLRWIVRTNAIHMLHPVVRLADGRLIVGDRGISTHGEFLTVEVAFEGMRWYGLDPAKVIVLTEVVNPNLRRVDEVGLAMLAPGGGHGIAGSANLSNVELFAYPIPR